MYKESLLSTVSDNYDSFTTVEKTIADYFLQNKEKADFSSKVMKERLYVSEASLSRFAQKMGFKGYRDFIYWYERVLDLMMLPNEFHEVLDNYKTLIDKFNKIISIDDIKLFCQMLSSAVHVIAFGIGSSGLAAMEMKFRFMRLGIMIEALDRPDDMRMQSVMLKEDCLAVGISISGEKSAVLFSLRNAKAGGAKAVLITANNEKDYPFADLVLNIPGLNELSQGTIITPQFPVLLLLDICYHFLYHSITKSERMMYEKTLKVLKKEIDETTI